MLPQQPDLRRVDEISRFVRAARMRVSVAQNAAAGIAAFVENRAAVRRLRRAAAGGG
jgi:hypothetical protein